MYGAEFNMLRNKSHLTVCCATQSVPLSLALSIFTIRSTTFLNLEEKREFYKRERQKKRRRKRREKGKGEKSGKGKKRKKFFTMKNYY